MVSEGEKSPMLVAWVQVGRLPSLCVSCLRIQMHCAHFSAFNAFSGSVALQLAAFVLPAQALHARAWIALLFLLRDTFCTQAEDACFTTSLASTCLHYSMLYVGLCRLPTTYLFTCVPDSYVT